MTVKGEWDTKAGFSWLCVLDTLTFCKNATPLLLLHQIAVIGALPKF